MKVGGFRTIASAVSVFVSVFSLAWMCWLGYPLVSGSPVAHFDPPIQVRAIGERATLYFGNGLWFGRACWINLTLPRGGELTVHLSNAVCEQEFSNENSR